MTHEVREYSPSSRRDTFKALAALASAVAIGLVVASSLEAGGEPRLLAVFTGAFLGFFAVYCVLQIWGGRQRARWRRRHGCFPIPDGTRVRLARGPLLGRTAVVRFPGQAPSHLYVDLEDEPPETASLFVSHDDVEIA